MSIVRITWALISAAYATTMLLCLVVTANAVSGELAVQLALQARPVAEQAAQTLAAQAAQAAQVTSTAQAKPATPVWAEWMPTLVAQARQAQWAQVELHDDQDRLLGRLALPQGRGWTCLLAQANKVSQRESD